MTRSTSVRMVGGAVVGGRVRALPPRPMRRRTDDSGMVLLETALAIPLLAAVAVLLAWALNVGATSLALGDAARAAARDIARGESPSDALARASATLPAAQSRVEDGGDAVVVVLTQEVRSPVPGISLLPVTVTQRVSVPREWAQ